MVGATAHTYKPFNNTHLLLYFFRPTFRRQVSPPTLSCLSEVVKVRGRCPHFLGRAERLGNPFFRQSVAVEKVSDV
jgi:hypothetical protein